MFLLFLKERNGKLKSPILIIVASSVGTLLCDSVGRRAKPISWSDEKTPEVSRVKVKVCCMSSSTAAIFSRFTVTREKITVTVRL